MYIDTTTNEWGLTPAAIMQRHPLTVFPDPFSPLEQYAQVADQPQPFFDAATHKTVEQQPLWSERGYLQQWHVVPLNEKELAHLQAERLAAEQTALDSNRITISRTQGLIYIYRMLRVTEADIEIQMESLEDEDTRYEATLYFRSATWDSDNQYVLAFGACIGWDTPAKVEHAFRAARGL